MIKFLFLFLIEEAVRLPADIAVRKRHPAALADKLSRWAEQRIDGNIEEFWEQFQGFDIRRRLARFPKLKILVMYECLRLLT